MSATNKRTHERLCLKKLCRTVVEAVQVIDEFMEKPENKATANAPIGKALAKFQNALEMENDSAMHFGLGMTFAQINKVKKKPPEARRQAAR